MFVPAGRIYGLGDKIPFHVQISGAVHALRELFTGTMLDRVMSADSHNTVETLPKKRSAPVEPLLRVTLLRQISVTLKNAHSWKNISLAEGSVSPVPPDLMSWYAPPGEFYPESHIDWEGELSVSDGKLVSGFMAAHVQVKVSTSNISVRLSVNLLLTGLHLPYNNPAQHLQTNITNSPKNYHPY